MKRKLLIITVAAITAFGMCLSMAGCGGDSGDSKDSGEAAKITIVQQYGMAYAPLKVIQEKGLIEENYDGEVEVDFQTLNSGASINDAFVSGDVDVGLMGVAPAITGSLNDGVPYKICSNISAQPHRLMTNDPNIKSLKDIGEKDQIALVNIGSIQHILLAMAAKEQLGDAHALDNNIAAMAHPDGMTALLNGSVKCQLTTSPYVFKEAEEDGISEVKAVESVWPEGNSFIVAVASTDLYENNPDLYNAVLAAFGDAIAFINEDKEDAAEMLCVDEDVDAETFLEWLNDPACSYSTELKGVSTMAKFMTDEGFLEDTEFNDISQLVYDGVEGD
ncbi:MAG: ABC transporter substrate-binding protein [Bacillota bacterium]|nr:ABC transporter substrate-binding protein [Bacillota bacterium]